MTSIKSSSKPVLTDAEYASIISAIPIYEVSQGYVRGCKRILRALSLITIPNPSALSWLMYVVRMKPSALYSWDVDSSPKRHFISVYPVYVKYYIKAGGNPEMKIVQKEKGDSKSSENGDNGNDTNTNTNDDTIASISYDPTFSTAETFEINVVIGRSPWFRAQTEESRNAIREVMGKYYMTSGIDIDSINHDMTKWVSKCIEKAAITFDDSTVRDAVVSSYNNYVAMTFINAGSSKTFDCDLIGSLTKHTKFSKTGQFLAEFGTDGRLVLNSLQSLIYITNLEMTSSPNIAVVIDSLREMMLDMDAYQTKIREFNIERLESYQHSLPYQTKLANPQDKVWDQDIIKSMESMKCESMSEWKTDVPTNDDILNYPTYNLVPYEYKRVVGYYVRGMPRSMIKVIPCLFQICNLDAWSENASLPHPCNLKDTFKIMNSHIYYISARNKVLEGMKMAEMERK